VLTLRAAPARDVLIEYGKLMKYTPKPSKNAYCYDGPLVLRQFGPNPNDAADVLETYPWYAHVSATICGLRYAARMGAPVLQCVLQTGSSVRGCTAQRVCWTACMH